MVEMAVMGLVLHVNNLNIYPVLRKCIRVIIKRFLDSGAACFACRAGSPIRKSPAFMAHHRARCNTVQQHSMLPLKADHIPIA